MRKATLASILRKARHGIRFNEHLEHDCGLTVGALGVVWQAAEEETQAGGLEP